MGKLSDIAKGMKWLKEKQTPFAVFGGGRRGGKSTMATNLNQLDPQQLSAQLAQLQQSSQTPSHSHNLLVPSSLAGQAQAVLGSNTSSSGGLAGTTTTTGTTWTTGSGAFTGTQYTQSGIPEEDYAFQEPKKKKYANDIERSIDEEVARIKNL
jgi:hypothetical protein